MNPQIQLWLDALRSGDYKQTISTLRYEDKFCCLGVACDVYIKNAGMGKWLTRDNWDTHHKREDVSENYGADAPYPGLHRFEGDNGSHWDTQLPNEVDEWLGLHKLDQYENPFEGHINLDAELIMRNDGSIISNYHQHNFEEIADFIEDFVKEHYHDER